MLIQAMDSFQLAKQAHQENVKGQHNEAKGSNGAKEFFRASEMGYADRKIIYSFFAHQLPKSRKTAKNLRQLENGDYTHERYQTAWEDMGALISMEKRLTSKDDEYLAEFPWEWAGHYDGELDMHILRAHALGKCKVESQFNEETSKWEIVVDLDEEYAEAIGIFKDDYEPVRLLADIKTMNPWGFKKLKDKHDVSDIQGYIDQAMFYMYMLNTPFGSIFVEDKGSNDVVEVQLVWKDLHDGVEYGYEEELHGEQLPEQIRLTVESARFFGDDTQEGLVPRIDRLWKAKQALELGEEDPARLMPERCSNDPSNFPCSWGKGKEKCQFFDHCWHEVHHGLAITTYEACPTEAIWEFDTDQVNEHGEFVTVQIDSRKVPKGVTQEAFLALVSTGALDYTKFLVDDFIEVSEALETAVTGDADELFDANGNLIMTLDNVPEALIDEALEYTTDGGERAIKCLNCLKEITFKKLGNGNVKKCPFCNHVNKVTK